MVDIRVLIILSLLVKSSVTQNTHQDKYSEPGEKSDCHDVGCLVQFYLQIYMGGCHVLLASEDTENGVFSSVLRSLKTDYTASVILDLSMHSFLPHEDLMRYFKSGEDTVTCRVFIFHLTSSSNFPLALEFMENINLPLIPNTFVMFLGPKSRLQDTFKHITLRNTANAIYLVVESTSYDIAEIKLNSFQWVEIYSRCLFCKSGEAGIRFIDKWNLATGFLRGQPVFEDQFKDMMGMKIRVVQLDWYPLVAYIRDFDEPCTTVVPTDSVNVRMLNAVSEALNFTYVMFEPCDGQWGAQTGSGNWTGIIGNLQHHNADFGMEITYVNSRFRVVDYSRIYIREPLVMVMSKPRPPPQYLAIIRPLEGSMWAAIFASGVSAGLILWLLQLSWEKVSNEKRLSFDMSLLYTWSILFEEPAASLPSNTSSLMFLGWWWIYCTLISAVYKSSLIAHLTFPAKSNPIDSFEEMLEEDGWTWGFTDTHTAEYEAFKTSDNPVIKKVYEGLEIQDVNEQVERILREKHVLLTKEFMVKSLVATIIDNRFGMNPFYYGKSEYFANGDGWAFRKNAPFYNAIDMKIQQLTETGHIAQWSYELIGTSPEEPCDEECQKAEEEEKDEDASRKTPDLETSDMVVLSLNHLQSAFYVLLLGFFVASSTFAGETLIHAYGRRKYTF